MTAPEAHRIATIRQQCEASEAMREARAMIALQAAAGRFEYEMKRILTEDELNLLRADGFRAYNDWNDPDSKDKLISYIAWNSTARAAQDP